MEAETGNHKTYFINMKETRQDNIKVNKMKF